MWAVPEGAGGPRQASAARGARAHGRDGRGRRPSRAAPLTIAGAIIAGGSASRLAGRPKGLEIVDGTRIIDRVADVLRPRCEGLIVAPGSLDGSGWVRGAAIAPDLLAVRASVVGIHAALAAARGDIVAIAWDMPFVPGALVDELIRRLAGDVDAVVPLVGGKPEPLCAAYSGRATAAIASAVAAGTLKNTEVLATLSKVTWLDDQVLRRFGDPAVMFFNVNTPADLARAQEIATA